MAEMNRFTVISVMSPDGASERTRRLQESDVRKDSGLPRRP